MTGWRRPPRSFARATAVALPRWRGCRCRFATQRSRPKGAPSTHSGVRPPTGASTDAIQAIDSTTGRASVVGHLPKPLAHASAIALGGRIYLLGGAIVSGPTALDAPVRSLEWPSQCRRTPPGADHQCGRGDSWRHRLPRGRHRIRRLPASLRDRDSSAAGPSLPPRRRPQPVGPRAIGAPPFVGRLLIADRGNNRLLVVDARKRVLWRYPGSPANRRRAASTSRTTPSSSTAAGDHLQRGGERDDRRARLPVGQADPVLRASRRDRDPARLLPRARRRLPADATARSPSPTRRTAAFSSSARGQRSSQIGTTGSCVHDPPRSLGSPNGDTPLANGDVLVSEVNGSYVDELTRAGRLVWSTHLPIAYPSDPQQLGPESLPGRRLRPPGRRVRVRPRRQDPLVLPPRLGRRDARPSEPRRAIPRRAHRGHRRLSRPGRPDRPADEADRLAVRPRPTSREPGPIG